MSLQTVHPRKLAAVRREVAPGAVGSAWGPALSRVWEFIHSQPGLRTDGHNIFVYHHATQTGAPILCDFGVEVTRTFETAGEVYATETPGGEAAVAVHRGPYHRLNEAHEAIGKWMAANRRESAGHSWEIYGDPTPDPADTETTVVYLLKHRSRAGGEQAADRKPSAAGMRGAPDCGGPATRSGMATPAARRAFRAAATGSRKPGG